MIALRLAVVLALLVPMAGAAAPTQFHRDPALTRAKQAKLVGAVRATDPRAAAQLQKAFAGDDVAAVAPAFRAYGFSTDDAADMTTAYWITAWDGAHARVGTATDAALAKGARAQLARVMAPKLAGRSDAFKQDIADTMLLQTLLIDARMTAAKAAGPAALKAASDTVYREATTLLNVDLRAVDLTSNGFTAAGQQQARPSLTGRVGSSLPVAGTYFRAIAGNGAAVGFEPLVLFANGDYLELGATPLADVDPALDKARAPARWGRWRKQGSTFLLTSSRGITSDYQLNSGNFFPAYVAAAPPRLSGAYSNTSGSGSFVLGGQTTTIAVDRLVFGTDGTFVHGKSAGGIAPNAAIGNRSRAAGRWRLDGSALELNYADGRRVRTSFLWGASGSPARPSAEMAFIGGDVFTHED